MLVQFLADYRGVLTGETFYQAGTVVDLDNAPALVEAGRAAYVPPDSDDSYPPVDDLSQFDDGELRQMVKDAGFPGYGRMKRATLIKRLSE